ncbi:hypothetical protein NB717_001130 [Xanthomonas sacchari]|uniref:hypothetical protein n=1 Tax=Xanthomonas sacchari TaxID=56458 RepID=UPI00225E1E9D|nr:hypothetical protein [Xanthomonas sacchari]MCW0436234.1 hypothetical protein [Xanthomonas sacchari]MCW0460062.1 hypothetical protein [Xanthomonas sacchari]
METKAKGLAIVVAAGLALSFQAQAQSCCPSGGHGVVGKGLGESVPKALNLATDSAWRVYEFSRDGVNYLQINDASGVVRAAVGRIGKTLWVLPMGSDVGRVSLTASPAVPSRVIYRTADVVVRLRSDARGDAWEVTAVE